MSDISLRDRILEELEYEPSINAAHIGVAVENGIVTLSGIVSSYAEKLSAEAAVRRVAGVSAIAEEIEVRYASDKKAADSEIARRCIDILRWSAIVPRNKVQITVQGGWVRLSGEVEWQYQRRAAEDEVRRLSGIVGVINDITLRPQARPADVKQRIEDALKRHAAVDAEAIHVVVYGGGRIVLEGRARDWQERMAAEEAAWSAPGVTVVEDRLAVAS